MLQYVELERRELPSVLLRLPPVLGRYTEQSAKIEADVSQRGLPRSGNEGGRSELEVC